MTGEPVAQRFSSVFDGAPEGVWSAPGRVNLIGEHTDYNQGLCLPIALPQRTYAAARRRAGEELRVHSLQNDQTVAVSLPDVAPGHPGGWASYVAGVLWALRDDGHDVTGMDVAVDSRVPLGAGLSSSAALECSVASAASDLFGLGMLADDAERTALASLCVAAENTIAGAPTGGMDQSAALLCRPDHALLLDCRDGTHQQVPLDLTAAGLVLLVMDTRAEHQLVDGQYAERRRSCEQAVRELGLSSLREVRGEDLPRTLEALDDATVRRRVRHVVTEIDRVQRTVAALAVADFTGVGRLFQASHASMRDDFQISCAELDTAVSVAEAHGALGARMTGGGFGGSAIALLPVEQVEEVGDAVAGAFSAEGFSAPHCFPVTASGSARRDTRAAADSPRSS